MNTEIFTGKAMQYANARPGYPRQSIDYICSLVPINAVEPNSDMAEQLKPTLNPYPAAKTITAPAESTTLPSQSVDVIVCAQALHWFDLAAFDAECRRIGKPGTIVIAIYNISPGGISATHSRVSTDAFFENPTTKEFQNPIYYTRDKWLAYMTSHSNNPRPTDDGYKEHIAKVNAIFDDESIDGLLRRDLLTRVYFEKWMIGINS